MMIVVWWQWQWSSSQKGSDPPFPSATAFGKLWHNESSSFSSYNNTTLQIIIVVICQIMAEFKTQSKNFICEEKKRIKCYYKNIVVKLYGTVTKWNLLLLFPFLVKTRSDYTNTISETRPLALRFCYEHDNDMIWWDDILRKAQFLWRDFLVSVVNDQFISESDNRYWLLNWTGAPLPSKVQRCQAIVSLAMAEQ